MTSSLVLLYIKLYLYQALCTGSLLCPRALVLLDLPLSHPLVPKAPPWEALLESPPLSTHYHLIVFHFFEHCHRLK